MEKMEHVPKRTLEENIDRSKALIEEMQITKDRSKEANAKMDDILKKEKSTDSE